MARRKIAIVTGSRAEYGHLFWIIKGVHEDASLELQLIVTGMHLAPKFGSTIKEIEKDEFSIACRVKMPLASDRPRSISESMGLGMVGFAKSYERLRPDILLVLGDRFEILSAAAAAIPFRIPVAHIHGGEATEGLIDESIRHSVTKMSHIHFVTIERYKKRVIQMGELSDNVFCFGAPGLDNIYKLDLMSNKDLRKELGLPMEKVIGIVTYHPVTLEKDASGSHISTLLEAIKGFTDIFWVFTFPNADTEGRVIIERLKDFISNSPDRGKIFVSLGQLRYLSLLKNAALMVGNSSSGLIEAPSFELPVVNVGDRQRGRVRGRNVIDVPRCEKKAIIDAIKKSLSADFKKSLKGMKNPYGEGGASEKIVEVLKNIPLGEALIKKRFNEILL